jgi:O-antigen/teichoic acid export membrane protein
MQLAFIPIYIKYLGMESYGLIGLFAVLQNALTLLDLGMTPVLNREMARFTAGAHSGQSIRVLLRSVEMLCAGLATLIIISGMLCAGWIAKSWLLVEKLPLETVSDAISLMVLVAGLRFVESIYRGSLMGLQTHVWLNVTSSALATLRGIGAVVIIIFVSPTLEAFFMWHGCVSLLTVIVLAIRVHRILPKTENSVRFSSSAISNVWSFAKGMIATTFLSLLLTQLDKIFLSRLLGLEEFGKYMLASTVANALMFLVGPLAQSYQPHFTSLVTKQDEATLVEAYHRGSQLMAVTVMPLALLLIFAGENILFIWTGNSMLAKESSTLLLLLSSGTAMLGLMNLPYMLQLAYGWTSLAAKVNAVIVVIQLPTLYFAIIHYGAIGAAWVWVGITSSYIIFVIPLMHLRLLPKEKWSWYLYDNLLPIFAAAMIGWVFMNLFPVSNNSLQGIMSLTATGFAMAIAAAFSASTVRMQVIAILQRIFLK